MIRDILLFRDNLGLYEDGNYIDYRTFARFIDILWPILNNLEASLNKPQEIQQELPLCKKYPVYLSNFEKSHDFCIRMNFNRGRCAGMIISKPYLFEGTYNQNGNKGERGKYFIDPDKFLERLLSYPYRNPNDRKIAEQYKSEYMNHGEGK